MAKKTYNFDKAYIIRQYDNILGQYSVSGGVLVIPFSLPGTYGVHPLKATVVVPPLEAVLLFQADLNTSGVSSLPTDLTINSVTVSNSLRLEASDIVGTSWTAVTGQSFSEAGTGASPNSGQLTPFTDGTEGVAGGSAAQTDKYYQANSSTTGNVGTNDFVIEAVLRVTNGGVFYMEDRQRSTNGIGWSFYTEGGGRLRLTIDIGASQVDLQANSLINDGLWHHIMIFVDRSFSSGCLFFVDGERDDDGSQNPTSANGIDIDSTDNMIVGNSGVGTQGLTQNDDIAYLALWDRLAWASSATIVSEAVTIAKERFERLCGIFPSAASGVETPEFSRTTNSTVDIIDNVTDIVTLHEVGSSWPRIAKRKDLSGSYITGYLCESQITNLQDYSEDFVNWTPTRCTIDTDSIASPQYRVSADGIVVNSGLQTNAYIDGLSQTYSAANYVASVYAKQGASRYVVVDATAFTAGDGAWFDLDSGTISHTAGGENSSGMDSLGNGWYRCWVNIASAGGSNNMRLFPSDEPSGLQVTGDGSTVNTYVYGAQLEIVSGTLEGPSSLIYTSGSTATRLEDVLIYSASQNVHESSGSIFANIFYPYDHSDNRPIVFVLESGASDYWNFRLRTDEVLQALMRADNINHINPIGVNVISGGYAHDVKMQYDNAAGSASIFLSGSVESTDSGGGDATLSLANGKIYIGTSNLAQNGAMRGLVSQIKTYTSGVIV